MRGAIAAAVVGGVMLGGVAATPAFAAVLAAPATPATPASPAIKTVVYHGYAFQVPASWPVYRLDEHPRTCVRYDVHAVYLGTPGASMDCPAGIIGRTEAVSLLPASSTAQPDADAGIELRRLPAVHSAIIQNAARHELVVALGATGTDAAVLGTYGTAPGVIEQVLSTLHPAPAGAVLTGQAVPAAQTALAQAQSAHSVLITQRAAVAPARARGNRNPTRSASPAARIYTSWRGVPSGWPTQLVQLPPPSLGHPVSGFDTCTAPSLATMAVWRRAFGAVGAYIGGINAACAYGNLSASWIQSVAAMGYGVLPTYVGPQATCWNGGNGVRINPARAAAQGNAAGVDAVNDARLFGLPSGSPIYYDMEAYVGGTRCKQAVLSFLGAWNRRVHANGYRTAVYSSRDSGIADIEEWTVEHNPGFTPPDAVWIALWDGVASLNQGGLAWPLTEQSKQYSGNTTVSVGGIRMNIDRDIVDGPVAR